MGQSAWLLRRPQGGALAVGGSVHEQARCRATGPRFPKSGRESTHSPSRRWETWHLDGSNTRNRFNGGRCRLLRLHDTLRLLRLRQRPARLRGSGAAPIGRVQQRAPLMVAVSGYGQDEDRCRSKDAGFDYHLTKPLDHDVLLSLITAGRESGHLGRIEERLNRPSRDAPSPRTCAVAIVDDHAASVVIGELSTGISCRPAKTRRHRPVQDRDPLVNDRDSARRPESSRPAAEEPPRRGQNTRPE